MQKHALRLYCLRYGKGGQMVCTVEGTPLSFDNKMVAKDHRGVGMVVSYGTDHKKYNHVKGDV